MLTICVPILSDNEGRALFQRLCEAYGMRLHRMAMLRTEDMVASEAQGNGHPGQFYESRDLEVLFQEKSIRIFAVLLVLALSAAAFVSARRVLTDYG